MLFGLGKELFIKTDVNGLDILDSSGGKVIENYQRFIPEWSQETLFAIGFTLFGILIVLALEWYGSKTRPIDV